MPATRRVHDPAGESPARGAACGTTSGLPGDYLQKERLDTFTDGVLAIVITLLVLELNVPKPPLSTGELVGALLADWRSFVGFLVSFIFVGGTWLTHTNVSRFVARADHLLLRLNLLLLLILSGLPFTTALMTTHLGTAGGRLAVAIYGSHLVLAALAISAFVNHVGYAQDLHVDGEALAKLHAIRRTRRWLVGSLAAATVLSVLWPGAAIALFLIPELCYMTVPLVQGYARRFRAQTQSP